MFGYLRLDRPVALVRTNEAGGTDVQRLDIFKLRKENGEAWGTYSHQSEDNGKRELVTVALRYCAPPASVPLGCLGTVHAESDDSVIGHWRMLTDADAL